MMIIKYLYLFTLVPDSDSFHNKKAHSQKDKQLLKQFVCLSHAVLVQSMLSSL